MPNISKIKTGQMPKAGDWNALADSYNGGTFGLGTVSGGRPMPPSVVRVKNASGADRSRFEAMEVSGLVMPLENDGSVDLVFEADTATASSETIVILLAPIEDGRIGFAVIDGPAMALVSGGSGSFAEIDAANNRLKPAASGEIKLLASPHVTDTKLIPVVLNVGTGGGSGIAVTPSGGIPGRTGAGSGGNPWVWGSASCAVVGDDGIESADSITVYNMVESAIGGSEVIQWKSINGKAFVDVEDC